MSSRSTQHRAVAPWLLAIVLAGVLATPRRAYSTPRIPDTPPVVGLVRDTSGVALPNVQVIVSSLNRVTTTDGQGRFIFRSLPAGTYHLTSLQLGHAPGHADVTVPATGTDTVRVTITMRPTPLTLSTIQVTATPTGTDPRDLAQSTVEISAQALARNLSTSLAQTLSAEPGVSVRFDGPGAAMPVIRGLSGERVLVLQDGQRAGDLASTSSDHSVSIDPLSAQRIEVVRGPASLLYGNNALGGVVNVISNDIPSQSPSHVEGYFAGQGETVSPGGAGSFGLTFPLGSGLALVTRGGARRVDDVRQGGGDVLENTFFRNAYGVLGLGAVGSNVSGGAAYRGYRFNYGLPSADLDGVHIEGSRHEAEVKADRTFSSGWLSSLRASGTAQWYEHDEVEASGAIGTHFRLRTQTGDVVGRTQFGRVSGAAGLSTLLKQYAAAGEEALTPAADSRGFGLFLFQELPLGVSGDVDPEDQVPRLQVGARYDLYQIDSKAGEAKFGPARSMDFNSFSGSLGISVPLGSAASLGVSAARAFRAPSVEELLSNAVHEATGTYDRGNPDLDAEINQGLDAVLRLRGTRLTGQLAGYYNRINNYILPNIIKDTTIAGEEGDETLPLNQFSQGDATLLGLEGSVEAQVAPHLVLGAMGDLVRGELRGGTRDGEPLPFIPAARVGGLIRFDNGRYSVTADVRRAFDQTRSPVAAVEDDPSAVQTDAYTLVNTSAGVTLVRGERAHSLTLRADNLLDEEYRDATSRIKHFALNPGRNLSLVYRILF